MRPLFNQAYSIESTFSDLILLAAVLLVLIPEMMTPLNYIYAETESRSKGTFQISIINPLNKPTVTAQVAVDAIERSPLR